MSDPAHPSPTYTILSEAGTVPTCPGCRLRVASAVAAAGWPAVVIERQTLQGERWQTNFFLRVHANDVRGLAAVLDAAADSIERPAAH